ncbi:MAG: RNA 2',3'-cyclic phosphodiesterase [Pseudomonadota bacterium]
MIRLFVAIPLPSVVRQRLSLLQAGLPGCRWTNPDNLHLTVRFIGDVDEPMAAEIDHALAALRPAPFDLDLAHVGYFGTAKKARHVWAGLAPNPALDHLHTKVDRAMVGLGLPPDDRRFSPHVTLGRLRDTPMDRLRHWLADHDGLRLGPITVEKVTLFESHRHAGGPTYLPLADYEIGGASEPDDLSFVSPMMALRFS